MKKMKKIKPIGCEKCEKMIPAFLDNTMPIKELEIVYNHFKNCRNCMEELTIQFLVSEGIEAVENSDNYDLVTSLNRKLLETERRIKNNRIYSILAVSILGIVFVAAVCALIVLIV